MRVLNNDRVGYLDLGGSAVAMRFSTYPLINAYDGYVMSYKLILPQEVGNLCVF